MVCTDSLVRITVGLRQGNSIDFQRVEEENALSPSSGGVRSSYGQETSRTEYIAQFFFEKTFFSSSKMFFPAPRGELNVENSIILKLLPNVVVWEFGAFFT